MVRLDASMHPETFQIAFDCVASGVDKLPFVVATQATMWDV